MSECDQCGVVDPDDIHTFGAKAGVVQEPLFKIRMDLPASVSIEAIEADKILTPNTAPLQEPDPCPGCIKGGVCKTPECGRLKLPAEHPYRTGGPAAEEPSGVQPVAWRVKWPTFGGGYKWVMAPQPTMVDAGFVNEALYTESPEARPSAPLTQKQRSAIHDATAKMRFHDAVNYAINQTELAHGIAKGTK